MKASSILAVLLLASSLCSAQELSRYELSGGISYGGIDTSDIKTPKGFAGSFATNVNRWLSMETSVGAQFDTQTVILSGSTTSLTTGFYSFLSGPRISYRRGRVAPFGHGLFGWARSLDYGKATYNPTNLTFTVPYGNALGAAAGGGVDYWITRHIALRTQGDYFLTQPDGSFGFHMTNNFRIVGGIVFSFGSTPSMTARMSRPQAPASRRRDAIAKQTPQTAAPNLAPVPPSQAKVQPWSTPTQAPAAATIIQPSTVTAKQTSSPAQTSIQPSNQPTPVTTQVAVQPSAVVAKQTNAPAAAPAPAVAPRQDPFTQPAKPANPVATTSPVPVAAPAPPRATPPATAYVHPAAAPPADQPFSLGEYARKLRQKKESQPKDWN